MKSLNQGFTLVELIITLALAAVVVGIAAPSVTYMISQSAVVSINNEIVADIQFTRSNPNSGINSIAQPIGSERRMKFTL